MAALPFIMMAAGTAIKIGGTLRQGKMAEKVGDQRAAVDRLKGDQTFDNAKTRAEILAEKRNRLVSSNLAKTAAGNVMINSPMATAATKETERVMDMDITNILNQGRQGKTAYYNSAEYEEALGKSKKKQSVWDSIGIGLGSASPMMGSMGMLSGGS